MKVKTRIKYEESYLPPRCRKLRYRDREEFIDVNLTEASMDQVSLAFEDNSFLGYGKIYAFRKKLWRKIEKNELIGGNTDAYQNALEVYCHMRKNSSEFFPRSWRDGEHPDKKYMVALARRAARMYLVIGGDLYVLTEEPRYLVNVFGMGNNHGGTGLFCEYAYNTNIPKDSYFSALQGEEAVAYANLVAEKRGDTKDIGKFKPFIICHMPELVKIKPNKWHDGE